MGQRTGIKRKENESIGSIVFRFTKKVKRSGVLKEAKKRRFHTRTVSRLKRREKALRRETRQKEIEKKRKLGLL